MTQGAGGGRPRSWAGDNNRMITLYGSSWFLDYLRDISDESPGKGLFLLIKKVHSMSSTVLHNPLHPREFYDEKIKEQENLMEQRKVKEDKRIGDMRQATRAFYSSLHPDHQVIFKKNIQVYCNRFIQYPNPNQEPSKEEDKADESLDEYTSKIIALARTQGLNIPGQFGKRNLVDIARSLGWIE